MEAGRVVGLVEPHRHRQLRDTSREALRQRADAGMADERRAPRQHLREWDERFVMSGRRQRWKMSRVPREQKRPAPEARTRVERGFEEAIGSLIRRAWRKENRGGPFFEELDQRLR